MCGENDTDEELTEVVKGSPPRVRGKLAEEPELFNLRRITPACAGKTIRCREEYFAAKDHPRVCGENMGNSNMFRVSKGSPPRVRGKHRALTGSVANFGITPACAGKTTDAKLDAISD